MNNTTQKLKTVYQTDERVSRANEHGLAVCGIAAFIYAAGRIIYCGINGKFALPEFILLLVMGFLLIMEKRKNGIYTLPNLLGKTLDPAPEARMQRIGMYILDGAVFAAVYTIISVMANSENRTDLVRNIIVNFLFALIMMSIFNFIRNELQIRGYNQQNAALEADENDLSE